jgi:hypothetical protein
MIQGPKGKYLPVQQVRRVYRKKARLLDGIEDVLEEVTSGELFVSHFETCPDAAQHSRRRKEKPHA